MRSSSIAVKLSKCPILILDVCYITLKEIREWEPANIDRAINEPKRRNLVAFKIIWVTPNSIVIVDVVTLLRS